MNDQYNTQDGQSFFSQLQEQTGFKIAPCETNINFSDRERYKILNLTPEQKRQISELTQHIPAMTAAGAMAKAYTVSFPQGLPHTLMTLRQGGVGSSIVSNGKILGTASFFPMLGQAAVYGVFTAMSIATGQFFLAQINKELKKINQKLDEIIKFLYGDKKAELISEVSFIKYAYDNFVSIMEHESQRMATIISIQEARKVAMKDIEFYTKDIERMLDTDKKQDFKYLDDLLEIENKMKPIEEDLDLSVQLYIMSSLLEVYYANNYEKSYINNLKADVKNYIDICMEQRKGIYSILSNYFKRCKSSGKNKEIPEEKARELDILFDEKKTKYNMICEKLYHVLETATKETAYYLQAEGDTYDVYYKAS